MGNWQDLALGLALFLLAVVGLLVVVSTTRFRRLPIQRVTRTRIERSSIPADEAAILDTAVPVLTMLGFAYSHSELTRKPVALPDKDRGYSDVFTHPQGVLAGVSRAETPDFGEPTLVTFASGFRDAGSLHMTANRFGHMIFGSLEGFEVFDDCEKSVEAALRGHMKRVEASGREVERDAAALVAMHDAALNAVFDGWLAQGTLVPAGTPDRYRLTWRAAFLLVVKVLVGSGRSARAKPPASATPSAGIGTATALEQDYAVKKSFEWSRGDKHWLTWMSLVGFALLGVWIWDWLFMLILLAVIALHEGGHYLAMRSVGYKNLHVFFLPGLGGVATGTKADASPLQRVFVYLAGPMPGLVIAVAALVAYGEPGSELPGWVTQLVLVTVVINFLNLLPVTPLDGGRVAEILLFAKVPLLRLLFAGACALALVAAGFYLNDWVLRTIGLLVCLTLPHQWRVYRIERALPPRDSGLAEAEARSVVFEAVSRPEFSGWSFANRSAAAMALVDEVQARKPRWTESIAGLAIYAACLVAPALAFVELTEMGDGVRMMVQFQLDSFDAPKRPEPVARVPARDWKAELAKADALPPDARVALYLDAVSAGYFDESMRADLLYLPRKAWSVASGFPPGDSRRGESLMLLARLEGPGPARQQWLAQIEEEFARAQGRDRLFLARAADLRSFDADDDAESEAQVRKALDIRAAVLPPGDEELVESREAMARWRYLRGARDEAGALLKESVDARAGDPFDLRAGPEAVYASYLASVGRAPEAEERLAALATHDDSVMRQLALVRIAQRTPEASRRALAALDALERRRSLGTRSVWKQHIPHQLDRLAAARGAGDAKQATRAEAAIRKALSKRTRPQVICAMWRPEAMAASAWARPHLEAQAALMGELGLCPPGAKK